jgi:ATP-binding cassette, subfamily B, bacterial
MTFIGAFALMLTVHPQLALITATIVPLIAWLTSRYGSRMTANWQKLFGSVGSFNARIEENVGGIRVVQAFANEDHERSLFAVGLVPTIHVFAGRVQCSRRECSPRGRA